MKFLLPLVLFSATAALPAAEVFEAALGREAELPTGKEADGIRGDFVLRSNMVEALVSQNAHNRRANMSTFYGEDGVTPGCLFDLAIRGSGNDQLICYGPVGHGPVSYVRIVTPEEPGTAAVEAVTTAAKGAGIYKRNEYRVRDSVQGIFITSTLRNETDKPQKVNTKADFTRFNETGSAASLFWVDAVDPADKAGYAQALLKVTGADKAGGDIEIAPGKEVVIERFLAVGRSPAEAVGIALHVREAGTGTIAGKLVSGGKPVTSGGVIIPFGEDKVIAYPDAEGRFTVKVKPGTLELTTKDLGREPVSKSVTVTEGKTTEVTFELAPAASVRFAIKDDQGRSTPCKVMFEGIEGTPSPDLGPPMRAHGCKDQYHSENGEFAVQLPVGKYRVRVVRGSEYSSLQQDIDLGASMEATISGVLKRVVDSKGWISADFHNHSTQSGDNICGTNDRIINLAAEMIEWAPTTEHNRFYDWRPHIEKLELTDFINTIPGIELTGSRQHVNAFPFTPDRYLQDGGAPVWNDDPRITVTSLRRHQGENPDRWIQFNHPDMSNMFVDRDGDGVADGGFVGVGDMIDGLESQNGNSTNILHGAPFTIGRPKGSLAAKASPVREFIWLQMLNQGRRFVAVGVADSHSVYGNGVGGWHVYLPSSSDEPKNLNWSELSPRAKAGNMLVTNGPFMTVTTPDGKGPGDDTRANGSITLAVKVQGTDWIGIDRVQVLVNSRPDPKLNFTKATHAAMFKDGAVKFDEKITIPLEHDAQIIVVAMGEDSTLAGGYGTSDQAKMHPCCYNNPIYVDVDGHGFKANGDTLDYEIPVMGINADRAKALLERSGKASADTKPAKGKGKEKEKDKA